MATPAALTPEEVAESTGVDVEEILETIANLDEKTDDGETTSEKSLLH